MREVFSKIRRSLLGLLPAIALMLSFQSVSATCFYWVHQPDIPDSLVKEDKSK